MSGVAKAVGKVFKSVRKVAKKVWENKLLRTAIIVGAVAYGGYFLANGGALAAPASGEGLTIASGVSEGTTFTTVSGAGGGGSSAGGGFMAGGETVSSASIGAGDITLGQATAGSTGAGGGGVITGTELAGTAGADLAAAAEAGNVVGSSGIVDSVIAGGKAVGGWMQENPMATMMLGQGASGAMSSMEARKEEDRARAERESYGAMGYDRSGEYQGAQPGIVASQGGVATQAQKVRPIARSNLTQAYKQGLVRSQT